MRSIGTRSYSTRNKESQKYQSVKYRSARDTGNMYSNYLAEPLSKLPVFNNLLGRHAPKRSIDTNHNFVTENEKNPFKRSSSESIRNSSRKHSSKNSKCYGYDSNQYNSNLYTNEYSNSAQTSQFTFGPGPDSRISDIGASGTNSANKSVSKENILYTMKDVIKQKKIRHKSKKSTTSDKHQRNDSRTSKKGKKHFKKKSNRQHTPSLNGYFNVQTTKNKQSSKSRNHLYQSSTSNYSQSSKSKVSLDNMFKSNFTPSHHHSYFNQMGTSPFLTKMGKKAKNTKSKGSRNVPVLASGASQNFKTEIKISKAQVGFIWVYSYSL